MAFKNPNNRILCGTVEKMLTEFVERFTDHPIDYVKKHEQYFLKDTSLEHYLLPQEAILIGLYLGKQQGKQFIPSFNLLGVLAEYSKEKVFVNDLGEIDFLYGKHLRKRHVADIRGVLEPGRFKLVQNRYDENIGYGIYLGEQRDSVKILHHVLDRGIFIKRDKQLKK